MSDELLSMATDLEELAKRLGALIDLYAREPASSAYMIALRSAREKARCGVELILRYREGKVRIH